MPSHSVSLIIPAFRAEPFIERTVRSVLAQTAPVAEIVIASDDGVDYARLLRAAGVADARLRCVFTERSGSGAANARNTALDAATGRVIATLDADDVLAPGAVARLAPLALQHGAAYARTRFVDEATGVELESFDAPLPEGPVSLEQILTSQIHTYAGVVFDRDRVSARWPEWLARWEDVYFFVRCFDDVEHMYHVAEPLYTYHRIDGSVCNRPEAGKEYLAWAELLASRIEQGLALGVSNPQSRELLRRFMRGRQRLEHEFVRALAAGECSDFHSFTRANLEAFYSLDGVLTPSA